MVYLENPSWMRTAYFTTGVVSLVVGTIMLTLALNNFYGADQKTMFIVIGLVLLVNGLVWMAYNLYKIALPVLGSSKPKLMSEESEMSEERKESYDTTKRPNRGGVIWD